MFSSVDDARRALSATFSKAEVALLVETLRPAIGFVAKAASVSGRIGETRIGGTPDLPAGLGWPVRQVPANLDEIAARGGSSHADEIKVVLGRPLSYEFLMQIDLAEVAALESSGAGLPTDGRLLVFYDSASGPWNTGRDACRVIWDTSDRTALTAQTLPRDLVAAGEDHARRLEAAFREAGLPAPAKGRNPYAGPARAMTMVRQLRLPHSHAVEAQDHAGLAAALADDAFGERYLALFDAFWSKDADAMNRQQLLGSPVPEQDDPRYDAVVMSQYGTQHLTGDAWRAAWPAVSKAAADWQLLIQVDLADYLRQGPAEGTVYVVIRRDDLAARRFENAVAVYQQT